jgi:hypothetical protein
MLNSDNIQKVADFLSESMLMLTNPHFLSLLLFGWGVGLVVLRLWFKKRIANAESGEATAKGATVAAQARARSWKETYELERDQHRALKEAVQKEKPAEKVAALEFAYGRKAVRQLVAALDAGENFTTAANPLAGPSQWPADLPLDEMRHLVLLAYTTESGASVSSVSFHPAKFITSASSETAGIVVNLINIESERDKKN